jgi:hypothetical protein
MVAVAVLWLDRWNGGYGSKFGAAEVVEPIFPTANSL